MLSDYFEDFTLLEHTRRDDGLGGTTDAWDEGAAFRGGVTAVCGQETHTGEAPALRTTPMLLHEWDITLVQGDRIRRKRDGAEYRVAGQSSDMRTPAFAGVAFAQVPVERLVTAP